MFEYFEESYDETSGKSKTTLAEDGIEFKIEDFKIENEYGSTSGSLYTLFKLDLKNGLKIYEEGLVEEDKNSNTNTPSNNNTNKNEVKNPSTGDGLMANIFIGVLSLGGLLGVALVTRKKLS